MKIYSLEEKIVEDDELQQGSSGEKEKVNSVQNGSCRHFSLKRERECQIDYNESSEERVEKTEEAISDQLLAFKTRPFERLKSFDCSSDE